jgi:serine/threonine-protein kinase
MRAGVDAVLAEYARAIEARDLVALRRAYPGMTADQQRGWRTFFASVRDVRTRLAVAGVRGVGDHVVADVRGSYEFQNRSPNRAERAPVRFRATVTRSAEGWRLRAVE